MKNNGDDKNIINFPFNNDDDDFNKMDYDKAYDMFLDKLLGINDEFDEFLSMEDDDEDLVWELFEQALMEEDPVEKQRLLEEARSLAPNDLEVQVTYTLEASPKADSFPKAEAILDDYYKKHKRDIRDGYLLLENRPYLRMKMTLATYASNNCLYGKAEKHLVDILDADKRDSLGARYTLMAQYVNTYKYPKAKALFNRFAEYEDDQMHLYMITIAILAFKFDIADKLIDELAEMNDSIYDFFKSPYHFTADEEFLEIDSLFYSPFSYESLEMAFKEVYVLYLKSEFLYQYFRERLIQKNPKGIKPVVNILPLRIKSRELANKGIYKDISAGYILNLLLAGYETKADYKQATRDEILAVKGIGKVTVEKLEKNGVKFKKD